MNSVQLLGRMTKDPELKLGRKTNYVNYTLAVPREREKDKVDFIYCVSFGKTAEVIVDYVPKGHRIIAEGSLTVDNYENKEGRKATSYKVIVQKITFIERKDDSSPMDKFAQAQNRTSEQQTVGFDEEIPF